jgi:hypothetical protein
MTDQNYRLTKQAKATPKDDPHRRRKSSQESWGRASLRSERNSLWRRRKSLVAIAEVMVSRLTLRLRRRERVRYAPSRRATP